MSFIFGMFNRNGRPLDPRSLRQMDTAMSGWGSDSSEIWQDGAVGLGHRRLHHKAESSHDTVPLCCESGQRVLTSCGRLDNRDDLCQLLAVPAVLRARLTDSDLILRAYVKWGTDCPRRLLGDWSFSLWDEATQQLFVARDQFGHSGLYYYQDRNIFVFASALSAVLAAPGVPREFHAPALATLARGYPRDDTTPYRGVLRLPFARCLTVTPQNMQQHQYWHPGHAPEVRLRRDDDYVEAFREIYTTAVRCRLRGDHSTGVTLSGGLDSGSTAVLAAMEAESRGQRLTAFTSVPKFDGSAADDRHHFSDERPYVEMLQQHRRNIDVHYITADHVSPPQSVRRMQSFCHHPFLSPSNVFWLCGIMEEARHHGVGTLLTGHGGNFTVSWAGNRDEHLATLLRRGRLLQYAAELRAWKQTHRASLTSLLSRTVIPSRWFRERQLHQARLEPTPFRRQFLRSLPPSAAALTDSPKFGDVHPNSAHRKLSAMMITDGNSIWRELGAVHGLNVATPAIDVRLIEFCLGIPQDQYTRNGQRKLLIRRAMQGLMPEEFLWNEQRGRQAGDIIYRVREHRSEIEDLLSDLRSSPMATEILDLDGMAAVLNKTQTEVSPDLNRSAITVLLHGLNAGLFIQSFEAENRLAERTAA